MLEPRDRRPLGGYGKKGATRVAITAALPMYRGRPIGWLALESLCAQEGIDFDWELIVMEETPEGADPMGEDAIMEYEARLQAVGCRRIIYLGIDKWVPLSTKWVRIAQVANSDGLLLVAADNYAPPNRLADSHAHLTAGAHWVQCGYGLFYDIFLRSLAVYDWPRCPRAVTAICMAAPTHLVRGVTQPDASRHVDGWLYRGVAAQVGHVRMAWSETLEWKRGLLTNGLNNISSRRAAMMIEGRDDRRGKPSPFRPPVDGEPSSIEECLPPEVCERLLSLGGTAKRTSSFIL